jgi:phosphatidylserine decarboxylase
MACIWLLVIDCALFVPLAIKWGIKVRIALPWALTMGLVECAAVSAIDLVSGAPDIVRIVIGVSLGIVLTGVAVLLLFFRDPERIAGGRDRVILSPADGTVLYIKDIAAGEFPFSTKRGRRVSLKEFTEENLIEGAWSQIGIGMNLLNVHVNRTPIKGKVLLLKRIPGHFLSLRKIEALLENERVLTIIQGSEFKVGVVQIASRLVRRIVTYFKEGDEVEAGIRMGMIRFGSQVDLLIPQLERLRVTVSPGQEVKAGLSVIAEY